MEIKDTITKKFIGKNEIFADAFNYFLYRGEQVINPAQLQEIDPTELAVLPYSDGTGLTTEQRRRDVLKNAVIKMDNETIYLVLGIENQTEVDYTMPIRNMLYDALQYMGQIGKISNFGAHDKLIPVVTLVIYFANGNWTGPMCVYDMLSHCDMRIRKFIPNYTINLISPSMMSEDDLDQLTTDLKLTLAYIKYSKDGEKLWEVVRSNPRYQDISIEAAAVLDEYTDSKLNFDRRKGRVNVCKALEDIRKMGIEIGKEEGKKETKKEVILQMIKMGMSFEIISQALSLPVKEVERIAAASN